MDEAASGGEPELGGGGPCNGLKRARRLRLQHLGEERALPGRGGVETPIFCPGAAGPPSGGGSGAVGGGGNGNGDGGLPAAVGDPLVPSIGISGRVSVVGGGRGVAGCCAEAVDGGIASDPGRVPGEGTAVEAPGETGPVGRSRPVGISPQGK